MFHLLRGQVLRRLRKPLIVMTPKSLLRLPAATSPLDELATGKFHRVIHDTAADPAKVTRVLMCTGKIYYELVDERAQAQGRDASRSCGSRSCIRGGRTSSRRRCSHVPEARRNASGSRTSRATWARCTFVTPRIEAVLRTLEHKVKYDCIARVESASPATGSHKAHVIEQQQILKQAFAIRGRDRVARYG